MSVTHGMNVSEVQALGTSLQQAADRVVALAGDIDRLVQTAAWIGDDAGQFVQVWSTDKGRFLNAAESLRGYGQSALNNASAQLEVSDDHGGGSIPAVIGFAPCVVPPDATIVGLNDLLRLLNSSSTAFDAASLAVFVQQLGPLAHQAVSPETLRAVSEAFPDAPNVAALSAGFFVLAAAQHGVDYIQALAEGDLGGTLIGTGRLILDAGSLMNPYVAAANVGLGVGELITDNTGLDEAIGGNIFDASAHREYGTGDLTPQQAQEMVERYEGPGGFVNFLHDGGSTAWENFTGIF